MSLPVIIVPARLDSKRFPAKLLHPVRGKPLVLWTAFRIRQQAPEFELVFAVADKPLADCLETAGFQCVMTDPLLPSGTDRLAAANRKIGADRIINVQADEPLVTREQIFALSQALEAGRAPVATVARRFRELSDFTDPNKVKVVVSRKGLALYFSRSPMPFDRKGWLDGTQRLPSSPCPLWHQGLYAYTGAFLESFSSLEPSPLESCECLEQLRILENGFAIQVAEVETSGIGVDTPADIPLLEARLPL